MIIETIFTIALLTATENYMDDPVPEVPVETVGYPIDPQVKPPPPCDVCWPVDGSGK